MFISGFRALHSIPSLVFEKFLFSLIQTTYRKSYTIRSSLLEHRDASVFPKESILGPTKIGIF